MHILGLQRRRLILAAMVFLICWVLVVGSDEPTHFLALQRSTIIAPGISNNI